MWKYILVFFLGSLWASLAWFLALRNSKKVAEKNLAEFFGADTSADHIRPVAPCFQCEQFNDVCEGFSDDCKLYQKFADDLRKVNYEKNQN